MPASDLPELGHASPEAMAKCLASYIDNPDTIFRRVRAEFGTSPCHATIRTLRASHLRPVVHSEPYRPFEGYNPTDASTAAEKANSTFLALLRAAHPERFAALAEAS